MFLSSIRLLLVQCHQHKGAGTALSPIPPLPPVLRGPCVQLGTQSWAGHGIYGWRIGRSHLCSSLFNVSFELQGLKSNSEADPSLIFKSVLMRLFRLYHDINDSAEEMWLFEKLFKPLSSKCEVKCVFLKVLCTVWKTNFVCVHKFIGVSWKSFLFLTPFSSSVVSQASWSSWKRKAKALSPGLFMVSTFRQLEAPLHSSSSWHCLWWMWAAQLLATGGWVSGSSKAVE